MDLAVLAGLDPVAVLCEIVDDDGSMARLPKLRQFAERENLKVISIADLIRFVATFHGRCNKFHLCIFMMSSMFRFCFQAWIP